MASPCEVLIDCNDKLLANNIASAIAKEAWRIEDKYSRYNIQSVCGQLNEKAGQSCAIDNETFLLLQFADQCFQISNGLFDITSGILRKIWHFDCSDNIPTQKEVSHLLPFIGWSKTSLTDATFTMLPNMEIDLGGIGKEYAVDKAILIAKKMSTYPTLINFGGDIAVTGPRNENQAWLIGVEHPSLKEKNNVMVKIKTGAIATSGDANRYLLKNGKRYGHVLNVKTGWSVEEPPNAITVAAPQCIQAGFLATLALLHGKDAELFLSDQDIKYWAIR
ncbi:FAD:protein FMN transferase [Thalassotalea profundi]|uniref:FAD:protein FMN transferase n=1 Tax=Thalassotalea profundi TaxID=2036687 RepID=A0ABQ3ID38_9GAMM|nr:FAD:protein FMN transferase [Thalassotalea profundi]GHE77284.1 FAD:protein FMN transferase [Thalassotalea profundi]